MKPQLEPPLVISCKKMSSNGMPGNKYPVVLVHGVGGWGRDELFGVKYWGGLQGDIHEILEEQGFQVFTAAVGPFSSNWDRACELFAQIKGGQVDYGVNHSATHGHSQTGRTYPGFYPEWGTKDASGKTRKLHFIGHSMGGQTIRMLAQLLARGTSGAPIEEDPSTSSLLFQGGHEHWVHSITTISCPNKGTTFANVMTKLGALVSSVTIGVVGIAGGFGRSPVYDAKLDQWGLAPRQPEESLTGYFARAFLSRTSRPDFKDTCLWCLSTSGAEEENKWVTTLPQVFYFSYTTQDSHKLANVLGEPVHVPNISTMAPILFVHSICLGSRFMACGMHPEKWQANDGLVNCESMVSDGNGEVVDFRGISYRGKWNHMATLSPLDHIAMVGFTIRKQIQPLYSAHVELLRSLPEDSGQTETQAQAHGHNHLVTKYNHLNQGGVVAPFQVTSNLQHVVALFVDDIENAPILDDCMEYACGGPCPSPLTPMTTSMMLSPPASIRRIM